MMRFRPAALAALLLCAVAAQAQAPAGSPPAAASETPQPSALDAALFYQLLLGELNARGDDPSLGYSLILDAARRTEDPALYERAVEMAFQARSGDAALQAAQAWKRADPQSRKANRYVLQILVALNRLPESVEPLQTELKLAGAQERPGLIAGLPRLYSRVADKKQAATLVEQALASQLADPATAAPAWTAIGRLRLAADDQAGALAAAQQAQQQDPGADGPALLALELMDPRQPQAEAMVRRYLAGQQPLPELRMAFARALLDAQRNAEALQEIQILTSERPEFAEAWLVQGVLLVQDNQLAPAEESLQRYLELIGKQGGDKERGRSTAQAYLALAQIAEKRGDYAAANGWLDRIENSQDLLAAQSRRASLLARQGKLDEARALLRALPERSPGEARMKLSAEVQLLREHKQYQAAYEVLAQAVAKEPGDHDLAYEQAMMAEKLGDLEAMERLLRGIIAAKPDYHHAYNALGYSLADRGQRLQEAKALIQKALEFAPGDPFISDSLGWVEFRLGNTAEALRILEAAYKSRPDPEIAAHLGEVLWSLGQRQRAETIWREGLLQNADNETLRETLKRLKVNL